MNDLIEFQQILNRKGSSNPQIRRRGEDQYMQFLSLVGKQRINELWREIYGK